MLSAASSASFIADEQLALLARTLGAPVNLIEVLEPANVMHLHDRH
jgi:hypothetical protein